MAHHDSAVVGYGCAKHAELQRVIEQVSAKMLTQTLRGMERDGLIARQVRNVIPPHVEYRLNAMGLALIPLLHNLCAWANANAKNRDDARRRFDGSSRDRAGRATRRETKRDFPGKEVYG